MDLIKLKNIAIEAAQEAGKVIRQFIDKDVPTELKETGTNLSSQVVTEVDRMSEQAILSVINPSCIEYNLALVTEETEDDLSRMDLDYFWCIDPMDGTLAFINQVPGFTVSIALVSRDGTPIIGVIHDPSTLNVYYAIKGRGAYKNDRPIENSHRNNYLTYATDKTLAKTPRRKEMISILEAEVRRSGLKGFKELSGGGAVINAIRVLENPPACMIKFPKKEQGGGSIWDYAATACIFHELGLRATDFSGEKLKLNRSGDSFMNHEGIFYSNY